MIRQRIPARIGLLGNPSDGYNGKVLSIALANFWAEVTIEPAEKIVIQPNLSNDGYVHSNLDGLVSTIQSAGYLGGLHLLLLQYSSNIPRQCGLSGSSAIVIACLKCLIKFYDVSDRLPRAVWPKLALDAEKELGITAGLQDRVIQTYGGAVHMDFDASYLHQYGLPRLTFLDTESIPQLHLVYCNVPSSSGKMHSTVRQRYDQGEQEVHSILASMAELADQGYAKLTGSGGAVVALFPESLVKEHPDTLERASELCQQENFTLVKVQISPGTSSEDL